MNDRLAAFEAEDQQRFWNNVAAHCASRLTVLSGRSDDASRLVRASLMSDQIHAIARARAFEKLAGQIHAGHTPELIQAVTKQNRSQSNVSSERVA
jgi:hypothetical protein